MSSHFSMGAINKETLKYEYPKIASKENKYKCPSCDKDVIFRKGKIKQSHYAHKKSDNPCYYYDRPSESQIHKDAKMLMKMLLDNKTNMAFYRKCYNYCEDPDYIFEITPDTYNDSTTAIIEYKFQYNNSNRSADVALVENNNIKYIFEICYKNKTKEENRPEPWVEIDAETFINNINSNETNSEILIECKREHKCGVCEENENYERKQYYNMLEKMRMKEKEQTNEKLELFNMGKEDERTIKVQNKIALEREKERLERENLRKQLELEKEQERKKIEKEYYEKRRMETEYLKKILEQNNTCSICKINYCKCDTPNFIMDTHNRTICATCNKRKCKCVRITNFFKR
jgi:hypothetical protein